MDVLVTGSTGFVGRNFIERLAQRPNPFAIYNYVIDAPPWIIDLTQSDPRFHIFRNANPATHADVLVHIAAACTNRPKDMQASIQVAKWAIEEAKRLRMKRVILISSMSVLGDTTKRSELDESSSPAPENHYGRGKADVETLFLDFATESKIELWILRPALIYGPYVHGPVKKYLSLMLNWGICVAFGRDVKKYLTSSNLLTDILEHLTLHPQFRLGQTEIVHIVNDSPESLDSWSLAVARYKKMPFVFRIPGYLANALGLIWPTAAKAMAHPKIVNRKMRDLFPFAKSNGIDEAIEDILGVRQNPQKQRKVS